jgi:hypothetical protein
VLEVCDHGFMVTGSREGAKPRSPDERRTILILSIFALTDDAWSGRPITWPIIVGTWIMGATIEKCSVGPARTARWRSSLSARTALGVVGKTCIGVPTRLIYSLKSWIDK